MSSTKMRDRIRSEVFEACAQHYCPKHAAFVAETLLDPIPNAQEETFRQIGLADFYLRDGTLHLGTVLGLLADHLEDLWGGPNPVSSTLWQRGYTLYLEWWEKRMRQHEAQIWRIRHGVE